MNAKVHVNVISFYRAFHILLDMLLNTKVPSRMGEGKSLHILPPRDDLSNSSATITNNS
jgi:hypothetical protein